MSPPSSRDRPSAADGTRTDLEPARWLHPPGEQDQDASVPVYTLAVACELTGLHAQTLRKWDRTGIVSPQRTPGGQRRYSRADLDRLLLVRHLVVDRGLNLAGVRAVLELAETLTEEREANRHLRDTLRRLRAEQTPSQPPRELPHPGRSGQGRGRTPSGR